MKRTRKYMSGYVTLSRLVKPSLLHYYGTNNARLYGELENRGLRWSAERGEWITASATMLGDEAVDQPANGVVRIRVMANRAELEDAALRVIQGCMSEDMTIVSQSTAYHSRRYGWSRTYITAKIKKW